MFEGLTDYVFNKSLDGDSYPVCLLCVYVLPFYVCLCFMKTKLYL